MSQEKKVPEFGNVDDAARFWDKNSPLDFEGEFEVADVEYEPKREVLSVRFEPSDMVEISRLARRLGMDKSTFVRYLVKSYLRSEAGPHEEAIRVEG